MSKISSVSLLICILLFKAFSNSGSAAQFGDFTYQEYDTYIEIIRFPETYVGSIAIPKEIAGKPVTTIGDRAFQNCFDLTYVEIPDTVVSLKERAFALCVSLVGVSMPDSITEMEQQVFWYCESLLDITIPSGIDRIRGGTFRDCGSLERVTIPDNITWIELNAFQGCKNLKQIEIPDTVRFIGDFAFSACVSLQQIELPDSLITLEEGVFDFCLSLGTLWIPENVSEIKDRALRNCHSLKRVIIPQSVQSIGVLAFDSSIHLEELYFLGDAPEIDPSGFGTELNTAFFFDGAVGFPETWNGVPTVNMGPKTQKKLDNINEGIAYFVEVVESSDTSDRLLINPDQVNPLGQNPLSKDGNQYRFKFNVTESDYAFEVAYSEDLVNWTTNNVTYSDPDEEYNRFGIIDTLGSNSLFFRLIANGIDPYTFVDDYLFEEIGREIEITDFPEEIRGNAFIPPTFNGNPVTAIGDNAFLNCGNVWLVNLPESINTIGEFAFYGCRNLTTIYLPSTLASIGAQAFLGCENLRQISIPTGISVIEPYTFYECERMLSIELPEGIEIIRERAFSRCYNLRSIVIPESVTLIENNAFDDCRRLEGIYFKGDAPQLGRSWANKTPAVVYYIEGNNGFESHLDGKIPELWNP